MEQQKSITYDCIVKILVLGDQGVGFLYFINLNLKFQRMCDNKFLTNHMPTIGIDFKLKTIELDKKKIKLQLWDTAGQERFRTITQTYYKGAMGIALAYSIVDRKSFDGIENWVNQIHQHTQENISLILVACKIDLEEQREVSIEEGQKLAEKFNMLFIETSSKNGDNVDKAFGQLTRQIKTKILDKEEMDFKQEGIDYLQYRILKFVLEKIVLQTKKVEQQQQKQKQKKQCC